MSRSSSRVKRASGDDAVRGEFLRLYWSLLLSDRESEKLIVAAQIREQVPNCSGIAELLENSAYSGIARCARELAV
jgi:hypothetical protein